MGFRSEVRRFMKDYYNWRKKKDVTIAILRDQIRELRSQNEELMAAFLARDLPELKTYTVPNLTQPPEEYKIEEDESLAGETVNIPEK